MTLEGGVCVRAAWEKAQRRAEEGTLGSVLFPVPESECSKKA